MEMEIVKPFGDHVASEEADVICLSKQKVKLHFYRWTVQKDSPTLQGAEFASFVQRQRHTGHQSYPDNERTEISGFTTRTSDGNRTTSPSITPVKDNLNRVVPKQIWPSIDQHATDVCLYSDNIDGYETQTNQSNSKLKWRGMSHAPTPPPPLVMVPEKVHSGYLYIFHDLSLDSNTYEEFYVNRKGELSPVTHANKILLAKDDLDRDVRPTLQKGDKDWYEYTPSQTSISNEICVAFSPVQWANDQISDPNWWFERTQKIVCKTWKNDSPFNPNFDNKYVYYVNDTTLKSSSQKFVMRGFSPNWLYPASPNQELLKPHNNLSEIHVFLDDPLYLADGISNIVESKFRQLISLIESIKTGVSPDALPSREEEGQPDKDQCKYLHLLALTTYQFIFSNENNFEKYGDVGVDMGLLESLLAIKERASLSAAISAYRNDLGTLLTSVKYQNSLDVYLDNIETRIHDGRLATLKHLAALSKTAGSVDNDLRLQPDQEIIKSDAWIKEMSNLQREAGSQKLQKTEELLDKPVYYEKFRDCTEKEYAHSCPILANHFDNFVPNNDIDWITISIATRVFGSAAFLGEALPAWREIEYNPRKFKKTKKGNVRITFDIPGTESKPKKNRNAALVHNNEVLRYLYESDKENQKIKAKTTKKKLTITLKEVDAENIDFHHYKLVVANKNKYSEAEKVFSGVVNHPIFLVSESLLQIANVSHELKHSNENPSKEERLELWAGVVETTISVTNTAIGLQHQFNRSYSFLAARSIFAKAVSFAAKKIVPGLDAVQGLASATTSIKNKDHDAAIAKTAGVATNLLVVAIGGAATWPLLLLGIGFFMLAEFLKDDDIEHYLKFFPLSIQRKIGGPFYFYPDVITTSFEPDPSHDPHQVVQNLCAFMKHACSYGEKDVQLTPNKDDQTFEMHYIKLMNLLCPIEIKLTTYTSSEYWYSQVGDIQRSRPVRLIKISLAGLPAFSKKEESRDFVEVTIKLYKTVFESDTLLQSDYSVIVGEDLSSINIYFLTDISAYIYGTLSFRLNTSSGSMPLSYRNSKKYYRSDFYANQTKYDKIVQVNTQVH